MQASAAEKKHEMLTKVIKTKKMSKIESNDGQNKSIVNPAVEVDRCNGDSKRRSSV